MKEAIYNLARCYSENNTTMNAEEALKIATLNPDCDIGLYQKYACKTPLVAYSFAVDVPSANIEYCQMFACYKDFLSYWFAVNVPESDLEYCYNMSGWLGDGISEHILDAL